MQFVKLFLAFSIIGLFAFGGGYSALSIMEDLIVKRFNLLTISDFWKIVGIAQITPGPIALNIATFVGAQKGKIPGAIVATFSVIIFPTLLSFFLIILFKKTSKNEIIKGVFESFQNMIPVLIVLSCISLFLNLVVDIKSLLILVLAFLLIFLFPKFSILLKIIISGFISVLLYLFVFK
ncbi:MAG: chromate transporter [Exilispira sp.]|jgi:chromate transporter|nr:chromate transporter [Exilispira sp.]